MKIDNQEEFIRFMKKVNVNKNTGCWDWIGYKGRDGYGQFYSSHKKKSIKAPRYSFQIFNEVDEMPKDRVVRHDCLNRGCCNPSHLTLVPHSQKMEAAKNAGKNIGTRNGKSKFNEKQIIEIRNRHRQGRPVKQLADKYGVSEREIYYIIRGERYGNIPD